MLLLNRAVARILDSKFKFCLSQIRCYGLIKNNVNSDVLNVAFARS